MDTLGKRIKEKRLKKGLTQEELAHIIGTTRSTLASWEIDRREPDYETLQKLADFFNVSVDYLLGRTDIPQSPEQRISDAISDDPELLEFWNELTKRDDLQLLFKQTKELPPATIKRIIKYIKVVEDEEADE